MKPAARPVAVAASLTGALAVAVVDLALGLPGGGGPDAVDAAALFLLGGSLLFVLGLLGGMAIRTVAWALGTERTAAVVRALRGEPRGLLARSALAGAGGLAAAVSAGAPLAALAYERGSDAAAALAVAAGVALGALAFALVWRALRRARLPSPPWVLAGGALGASVGLGLALADGGPLEAMDGRAVWSLLAGAAVALGTAIGLARSERRSPRTPPALRVAGATALLGTALASTLILAPDPDVRVAGDRTALLGKAVEAAVRLTLRIEAPIATAARPAVEARRPVPRSSGAVAPPPANVAKRRHHLVLVTVDALRPDHLGFHGYRRAVSPALDAFAARSAVFERAYAQETKTKGSIPSLLTSRYPSDIHWGGQRYLPLGDAEVTIAEELVRAGYHTAAFVTHSYFLSNYRLNRGFAHYDTALVSTDPDIAFGRPSGRELTDRVLAHLARVPPGRPFFLWAHYFDPHHRYLRHPGFSRFGGRPVDRYDGEIAYTDHHIGRLLHALGDHPQADRIAVVVTADHGEAFGEHGAYFHGTTLHEEEIRVPLLVHVPGERPRRVPVPVGLVDLVPTLLELAGLPPGERHRGRSLVPAVRGAALEARPVFAEILPENRLRTQIAVVHGGWKLIYDEVRGLSRLYNLELDPRERLDRRRHEPLVLAELQSLLLRWRARPVPATATPLAAEREAPRLSGQR